MIDTKFYTDRSNEWKDKGEIILAETLDIYILSYQSKEIDDKELQKHYISLLEVIEQNFIDACYFKYCEDNNSILRDEFEDTLLEHGYSRHTISECDDGRDEFRMASFKDEYLGSKPLTIRQQYEQLKKYF